MGLSTSTVHAKDWTLLNVSYDPARERYADVNEAFAAHSKASTSHNLTTK